MALKLRTAGSNWAGILRTTLQLIFAVLLLILGVLVAIQGVKKLMESSDKKSNKAAA